MHMVWVGLTRLHLHLKSSFSSQGPLPKEDPVGVGWGGGEEGGCTGLGGQRHSHTDRLRGRERAGSYFAVALHHFVCSSTCNCDCPFYKSKEP